MDNKFLIKALSCKKLTTHRNLADELDANEFVNLTAKYSTPKEFHFAIHSNSSAAANIFFIQLSDKTFYSCCVEYFHFRLPRRCINTSISLDE